MNSSRALLEKPAVVLFLPAIQILCVAMASSEQLIRNLSREVFFEVNKILITLRGLFKISSFFSPLVLQNYLESKSIQVKGSIEFCLGASSEKYERNWKKDSKRQITSPRKIWIPWKQIKHVWKLSTEDFKSTLYCYSVSSIQFFAGAYWMRTDESRIYFSPHLCFAYQRFSDEGN